VFIEFVVGRLRSFKEENEKKDEKKGVGEIN